MTKLISGRYALAPPNHLASTPDSPKTTIRFFKVTVPVIGKWKGWPFIAEQFGDNYAPVSPDERAAIRARLQADPSTARELYGRTIGKCAICGKPLTDPESRARGIGPKCLERHEDHA